MFLIFDVKGGLCNQMLDIVACINISLKYNLNFTFRNCSFRNDNLTSWKNEPFEKLFNLSFLKKYKLYIENKKIFNKLDNTNTFNYDGKLYCSSFLNKNEDFLKQFIQLKKEYIVLPQFWTLYEFKSANDLKLCKSIIPIDKIINIFNKLREKLLGNENYNFIHYRYEKDFINFFKINNLKPLSNILKTIKFKNHNLKIYIASSNAENIVDKNDLNYKKLVFKNENDNLLKDLNFEEKAYIDYLFGLYSQEIWGNSKSSFSRLLNNYKKTSNYYI